MRISLFCAAHYDKEKHMCVTTQCEPFVNCASALLLLLFFPRFFICSFLSSALFHPFRLRSSSQMAYKKTNLNFRLDQIVNSDGIYFGRFFCHSWSYHSYLGRKIKILYAFLLSNMVKLKVSKNKLVHTGRLMMCSPRLLLSPAYLLVRFLNSNLALRRTQADW